MRLRNRTLALVLATLLAAGFAGQSLPAMAQTAATAPDPDYAAKVAIGVEIFSNLPAVRILSFGAQKGALQDPNVAALPKPDRDRLCVLIDEEVTAHGPAIVRKLAEGNVARFTVAQLNDILTLSKIRFMQDAMLTGADPALAPKENAVITADERNFLVRASGMPYITDFMDHVDLDPAMPVLVDALGSATHRFVAEKTAGRKG